jgi:hypothetical protein
MEAAHVAGAILERFFSLKKRTPHQSLDKLLEVELDGFHEPETDTRRRKGGAEREELNLHSWCRTARQEHRPDDWICFDRRGFVELSLLQESYSPGGGGRGTKTKATLLK